MRVIRRLAKWGLRLGIAVLAVTVAAVLYLSDANWRDYGEGRGLDAPVDAVLVLGGGVDPDDVLGYSSRRRVAAAVVLLEQGRTHRLIFLGGATQIPRRIPAGELMRDHALALGAPAEALLVEARSRTTFENLRFGFAIAEEREFRDLALLTDAFHVERARWLAAYFGRPEIGLVAATGFDRESVVVRVWSIVREALAWWLNLVKVAAWELMAAASVDVETRQELIR
jgi:uncharacterized SAM-binding protein YcdF (DUF218 family)